MTTDSPSDALAIPKKKQKTHTGFGTLGLWQLCVGQCTSITSY